MERALTGPAEDVETAEPTVRKRGGVGLGLGLAAMLAIILLGLGGAAYAGGQLLGHARRAESAADVAARVCTAYKTRDYAQITSRIDTRVTPEYPGIYDMQVLVEELRAQDAAYGDVTACGYHLIGANDTNARYIVTLTREETPVPLGFILILLRDEGGNWRISRDTVFDGQPH